MAASDVREHYRERVLPYYARRESRLGYMLLLRRTRHFGWYEPGDSAWGFSAAMRRMELLVGRHLALPPGSRVLDAGCGVGDVARTVARASGLEVTGIDGIETDVGRACRRSENAPEAVRRTRFLAADYHRLPFRDGAFHGVYTMESLVHSPAPEKALAEFHRVLEPRGRLVLFEYSRTPDGQLAPRSAAVLRRVCELAAMPGMLALEHGRLERLLDEAGFTVESVTDATAHMLPMLRAFAVLGRLPYFAARTVGRADALVNAMSGVELYRHREAWRYNVHVAVKG